IIDFLTLSLSVIIFLLFFVRIRLPPRSTLFPYTTLFRSVMKHTAKKVRRLYRGQVVAGFAGSVADAITLFEKFEGKLEEHGGHLQRAAVELTKDWRQDRVLRRLEAMMIVMDQHAMLLLSRSEEHTS